ncbi:hypothetical protein M2132_000283 [Dysgonomonas sp. PH5-45]|uniref:DUF3667 domain-containing protein n=1 Tax=unclassified Dysgonomonas TaxID=2630389 RepID=UPI002473A12A|nr:MULTISPECIES: DUF3667 domain-containing protein [unclassified Dysgonomonas]MDH6353963.1 hypothetical protein [Dysgonomonas sp. PH5-45]MDH6386865.1 hypothetical protein [Dysgonomonas sp. PH5-37]
MGKQDSSICKNCNSTIKGNYCQNCGQATKTDRINFHYLVHEIQHSIFHVDKGILFTIKELLLRPSITIKGYLEGKRVNLFKPFGFVVNQSSLNPKHATGILHSFLICLFVLQIQ